MSNLPIERKENNIDKSSKSRSELKIKILIINNANIEKEISKQLIPSDIFIAIYSNKIQNNVMGIFSFPKK